MIRSSHRRHLKEELAELAHLKYITAVQALVYTCINHGAKLLKARENAMSVSLVSVASKRTRADDVESTDTRAHKKQSSSERLLRPPPPLPAPPLPHLEPRYAHHIDIDDDSDSDPDELIIDEEPLPKPSAGAAASPAVSSWNPLIAGCRRVESVYSRLNTIDEGTYGVVHRAINNETKEIVALKKMKYDRRSIGVPITALREMNILMLLDHPNIIRAREVVIGNTNTSHHYSIYLVMDYCEHDLKILYSQQYLPFLLNEIKYLLYQLLLAIKYIHYYEIVHRDIKMSNLLYTNNGILKLCDFGLARYLPKKQHTTTTATTDMTSNTTRSSVSSVSSSTPSSMTSNTTSSAPMTPLVQTLWYRAPELLLGAVEYDCAVDMWSVGCIMAEMISGQPLLPGKGELDQIGIMFGLIGSPTLSEWPAMTQLPYHSRYTIKPSPSRLRATFPRQSYTSTIPLSDVGYDLLNRLLTYNPQTRITASDALTHPWFEEAPMMQNTAMMPTFPSYNEHSARKTVRKAATDELKR